ncbi:YajQ family cyclic di-GMP-binding protein [Janibacter limosus]|uniref:YajQ family cyclic di-GMP-binding protein n=1 Tax=Janibacter limosus TaxID=53458 RepID=UPI0035DAB0ED|nr:YajQ family cyclic di-GMP-binding protein [Janibacter limosus]
MASSSFDIVSKVDRREVDNALNRAAKEVTQRYDFKGVGASIEWSGDNVVIKANSADRVPAVLDVFESKLIRRGVSLKNIDFGEKEPQVSGKEYVLSGPTKEGIDRDNAKKISKIIRDEGPKGIKPQIRGDELRVTGKSRDELREVISLLKGKDLDVALQFVNYR